MSVRPPSDTVRVVVSGHDQGWMEWAQDDSPLINVWGDDRGIVPVAEEIASMLSARFIEEDAYPGDE